MSPAIALTLLRFFIAPVFFVLAVFSPSFGIAPTTLPFLLLSLLLISELSDAFDGYVARKMNTVTDVGKVLDPLADNIVRISIFLSFTVPPVEVPLVWVYLLIYRDSLVGSLRTLSALRGYALAARVSGKLKAIVQAIAAFLILFLMIPHSWGWISTETLQTTSAWIVAVTALYAAASGCEYLIANRKFLASLIRP